MRREGFDIRQQADGSWRLNRPTRSRIVCGVIGVIITLVALYVFTHNPNAAWRVPVSLGCLLLALLLGISAITDEEMLISKAGIIHKKRFLTTTIRNLDFSALRCITHGKVTLAGGNPRVTFPGYMVCIEFSEETSLLAVVYQKRLRKNDADQLIAKGEELANALSQSLGIPVKPIAN